MRRSLRVSARVARTAWAGESLMLVQPLTFMNASGEAVGPLMRRNGVEPGGLFVVVDDADLPLGRIRVKPRGSAGGHRGLASIIAVLGTEDFARVRVGIGRRGDPGGELAGHVLTPFSVEDRAKAGAAAERAADAVLWLIEHGVDSAMNRFNGAVTADGDGTKEMSE